MTGMDQFLAQHYGSAPVSEPTSEDVEKVAQAQLFLKLASDNGVDINSLNDAQVNELWGAVWNQQKTAEEDKKEEDKEDKDDKAPPFAAAKKEHDEKKEAQAKIAEAEEMGKIMAHVFVAEQKKIAAAGGFDFLKEAFAVRAEPAAESVEKTAEEVASGSAFDEVAGKYAIEKAASSGFDGEEAAQRIQAVLVLGPGESEKVASVPDFNDAVDVRSSELLELAGYPIDWSGTPFEKQADTAAKARAAKALPGFLGRKAVEAAKTVGEKAKAFVVKGAKGEGIRESGKEVGRGLHAAAGRKPLMRSGEGYVTPGSHIKQHGKELLKNLGPSAAVYGGGAAAAGGAGYGVHKGIQAYKGKDKESSAQFDIDAGNLAVEKAASAGWDTDQAVERLNAVLTLGAGDPAESEKVAAAGTPELQLDTRACELLEMAGYTINWS